MSQRLLRGFRSTDLLRRPIARTALKTARRAAILCGILSLSIWACDAPTDRRFDTPASTFRTYQQALENEDLDLLWQTHSYSYRDQQVRATWRRRWKEADPQLIKSWLQREIEREEEINEEIAYLLFDVTTLPDQRMSPFLYFIREQDGWKVTTHLDSAFHQALERAIEQGEYKLPDTF